MSYQIIYRGFAVKTSKGSFLMIENGSNNCWEAGRRRERSFSSYNIFDCQNLLFKDAADAISHLNHELINGYEIQMCRGKFENFVKRCFKMSVNIKKLLNDKLLSYYFYDKEFRLHHVLLTTEEDVFSYLNSKRYPSLYYDSECLPQ